MNQRTYMPSIHGGTAPSGQGDGSIAPKAAEFAEAWLGLLPPARQRLMRFDSQLAACAQLHAEYLSLRTPEEIEALPDDGHGSHVGRDNSTPNQRVRAAGYALPKWHGDGNTVEFNVRTHKGAARALELYLGSNAHRPALMGEGFWEPATVYGFGQVGSDWVVLVCPPEGN